MTDRKNTNGGHQPLNKGYQPAPQKLPADKGVQGGYQPTTGEAKPVKPPPKKP